MFTDRFHTNLYVMLYLYTVLYFSFVSTNIILKRVPTKYYNFNKKLYSRNDFTLYKRTVERRQNLIDKFRFENETDLSEPINYDYKDPWWKTIRPTEITTKIKVYKVVLNRTWTNPTFVQITNKIPATAITKTNEILNDNTLREAMRTFRDPNVGKAQTNEPKQYFKENNVSLPFPRDDKKLSKFFNVFRNSNSILDDVNNKKVNNLLLNMDPMMVLDVAAKNINTSNPGMHNIFFDVPKSNDTYTKEKIKDLRLLNDSLNKLAQYYNFTAHNYGISALESLDMFREGKYEPNAANALTTTTISETETETHLIQTTEPITTTEPTIEDAEPPTTKVHLTPQTLPSTTKDPNDTRIVDPPFPTMETPDPTPDTFSGPNRLTIPPHLLGSSSAEKPNKFMQSAQTFMNFYKVGYFSAYLFSLFEVLAARPDNIAHLFYKSATHEYNRLAKEEKYFYTFGEPITNSLKQLAMELEWLPLEYVKGKVMVLRFIAESRREGTSPEINSIIDYIDTIFQEDEGRTLIKSVEAIKNYPNVTGNVFDVLKNMSNAVFAPLVRLTGTSKKEYLIEAINKEIQNGTKIFPKELFYGTEGRRFNNETRFRIVDRDFLFNDTNKPDISEEMLEQDMTNKDLTSTVPVRDFVESKIPSSRLTTKASYTEKKKNKFNYKIINHYEITKPTVRTTGGRFKILTRTTKKREYVFNTDDEIYDDTEEVKDVCKKTAINFKNQKHHARSHKKELKHLKHKHRAIYKKLKKYKKQLKKGKRDSKSPRKHNNEGKKQKKQKNKHKNKNSAQKRNTKTYKKGHNENIKFSTYEDELSESSIIAASSQQIETLNENFVDKLSGENLQFPPSKKMVKKNPENIKSSSSEEFITAPKKPKLINTSEVFADSDTDRSVFGSDRVSSESMETTLIIPTTIKQVQNPHQKLSLPTETSTIVRTINLGFPTTTKKVTYKLEKSNFKQKWDTFIKNKQIKDHFVKALKSLDIVDKENKTNKITNWVKLNEFSSYSDEEAALKFNLVDAIRHEDVNFRARRRFEEKAKYKKPHSYGNVNKFSSYSSEEIVLKSKIYKEIGFNDNLSPVKKTNRAKTNSLTLRAHTEKSAKIKPINQMSSYSDDEELLKEKIKKANYKYRNNIKG